MNNNQGKIVIKSLEDLKLSESTRELNPQLEEILPEQTPAGQPPAPPPPPIPPDRYRGWDRSEPEPEPSRRVGVQVDQVERETYYQPVPARFAKPPLFGNIFIILLIILIAFAAGFLCAVWMGPWAFGIGSLQTYPR